MGIIDHAKEISNSDIHYGHYRIYTPDLLRKHITNAGLEIQLEHNFYLKPLPTSMLTPLPMEIHDGLNKLGQEIPDYASYTYFEAKIK